MKIIFTSKDSIKNKIKKNPPTKQLLLYYYHQNLYFQHSKFNLNVINSINSISSISMPTKTKSKNHTTIKTKVKQKTQTNRISNQTTKQIDCNIFFVIV